MVLIAMTGMTMIIATLIILMVPTACTLLMILDIQTSPGRLLQELLPSLPPTTSLNLRYLNHNHNLNPNLSNNQIASHNTTPTPLFQPSLLPPSHKTINHNNHANSKTTASPN
jgi:hypothetical protein